MGTVVRKLTAILLSPGVEKLVHPPSFLLRAGSQSQGRGGGLGANRVCRCLILLGTAPITCFRPAEISILSTLIKESSGLYTVSSTLFARVSREDRQSRFHCAVSYCLLGADQTATSEKVNVTVFCESGTDQPGPGQPKGRGVTLPTGDNTPCAAGLLLHQTRL